MLVSDNGIDGELYSFIVFRNKQEVIDCTLYVVSKLKSSNAAFEGKNYFNTTKTSLHIFVITDARFLIYFLNS